jgi:carbon dioxide concentrating mechanism protein CcmN
MPPLPLQLNPITTDQSFTTGNVVVAAGAAIAPGVLLQADGGCRIIVGQGVCLGLGCLVHASGGDILIGDGANLGAGVLVVGSCEIGTGAIVGSGTTIVSQSVPADALLPNGTVWVKPGVAAAAPPKVEPKVQPIPQPVAQPKPQPEPTPHAFTNGFHRPVADPISTSTPQTSTFVDPTSTPQTPTPFTAPNFGTPETPVSNYVYPDSNTLPKNPWEGIPPVPPPPVSMFGTTVSPTPQNGTAQNPAPQKDRSTFVDPSFAYWDSDMSREETQHSDQASPAAPNEAALAPKNLRPIYGQAYVNQILGKMRP